MKDAEADGALNFIASTYDPYDMVIRDGIYPGGRKLITFANILQHDVFPLARILQLVQKYGQGEMRRPVEIEFAVNLDARTKSGVFYLLQIRPMVDVKAGLDEDLTLVPEEKHNPRIPSDNYYVLGEYHRSPVLGRCIYVYYGSFVKLYPHISKERAREVLK